MPSIPAPDSAFSVNTRRAAPLRVWRWGIALIVVAVLHGAAGLWFERHLATFTQEAVKPPVQVELLKPQRIERQAAPAAATSKPPAPAPRRPAEHRADGPAEHVLHATQPEARPTSPAPATPAASPASSTAAVGASAAGAAAAPVPASAAASATAANAPHPAPGIKFSVPPSGDLHYNTFYNGVQNAPGTIHWTSTNDSYEIVVSLPLPFIGTFSYESHGHIDAFGLAPDQYIEKPGHRTASLTTFDRAAKRITFTRTPTTLALPDGAQDRFSMVMQLASLVRGDPNAYRPGVTREFYVVDNDSGELWPIETIGEESVQTAEGFVEARHFMRLPRRDGDRRRIDVWLAPSLGWLPVQIMQTEPNGTQVQLVWRGKLTIPGAENADSQSDTQDTPSAAPQGAAPFTDREQP